MSELGSPGRSAKRSDYVLLLRRRKWVLLVAVLVVAVGACAYSLQVPAKYGASADVLLNEQNITNAVMSVSVGNSFPYEDPERLAATQVDVARSSLLAREVVAAASVPGMTGALLLASSNVSPRANSDVLTFSVVNASPEIAARLATAYAAQYTSFRSNMDTKVLRDALAKLQAKLDLLQTEHASPLYAQLVDAQTKLETIMALRGSTTALLKPAHGASRIAPRPKRALILGGLAGMVLGLGLVFLIEALDKRVRSEHELEDWLGAPLLGRLPPPPIQLQSADKLVMVVDREGAAAEAFRRLRANIEFANAETRAHTIVVTSAVGGEGKTTTTANLAVALAEAGARVVVVDLDLRRPTLHRFFGGSPSPGVTDVTRGAVTLDDALHRVVIAEGLDRGIAAGGDADGSSLSPKASEGISSSSARLAGGVELLPVGSVPLNPWDFVTERGLGQVLAALRARADVVLIDTPPILDASDAMTVSVHADALLAVFRLPQTRRGAVVRVVRELKSSRAPLLGFIVTDASFESVFGVSYSALYRQERWPRHATVPDTSRLNDASS